MVVPNPPSSSLGPTGEVFNTSPKGPPIDVSQETSCCALVVILPIPNPILSREWLVGDVVEETKPSEFVETDIESCPWLESSMNWWSGFWDFRSLLCIGLSKESEQTNPNSVPPIENWFFFRSTDVGDDIGTTVASKLALFTTLLYKNHKFRIWFDLKSFL